MLVTLIADASFCAETKAGGYGIWIASQRGKSPYEGEFKSQPNNSTDAEAMAVVRGLIHAVKDGLLQKNDKVLVQTDCLGVIQAFTKSGTIADNIRSAFENIIQRMQLEIEFRHVRGHTTISEPRYAANRACDARAKRNMRAMRTRLQLAKLIKVLEDAD